MPSYLSDGLKQHCSGCGACFQTCSFGAIEMINDEDGFVYPKIDTEKCVGCKKCEKACPFSGEVIAVEGQRFFAAKSKDKSVIKGSSSGGAFYEITKAFCDENFVVFGAEMTDKLKVRHSFAEDFSQTEKFRKSKYVQSDTGDSFKRAKAFLDEGRKVLFSGTPCQITGLKNFLGKDYSNLVTVDIVCHGVPSQQLFDKYIKELSAEAGEKITSFTFRNKKDFDKKSCNQKTVLIKTESGREIVKEVLQCEYLAAFHEAMFYRPSCGKCPFANTSRVGDITLADFWGAEKYFSDFDDGRGVSLVIVNSEKGAELFGNAQLESIETDMEKAVGNNAQLRRPVEFHKNREKFFELNKKQSFCQSVRDCMFIPSPLRYRLYKIKNSLLK